MPSTYRLHLLGLGATLLLLVVGSGGAWDLRDSSGNPPNEPVGCEDLSSIPVQYNLSYAQVHEAWLLGGCTGCHNNKAMGKLRLDVPEIGIVQLVNQPSYRNGKIIRVKPLSPDYSQVFQMLNCTPPATYQEMPPSMTGGRIAAELRARVYDWIAEGARGQDENGNPVSDTLFVSRFESQRFQLGLQ